MEAWREAGFGRTGLDCGPKDEEDKGDSLRGAFQGVQGATVLHALARLYEITIQGATQGATKCNAGCYMAGYTWKRSNVEIQRHCVERPRRLKKLRLIGVIYR